MVGVIAATSQAGLNIMQDSAPFSRMGSGLRRTFSALSPMKSLSDEEYEHLLNDKLLKVEVEIAVLDDQIADLYAARAQHTHAPEQALTYRPG